MAKKDLAQRLWDARIAGQDAAMEPGDADLSLEDAYRLQKDYVQVSGERLCGWKVGATNPAMQSGMGLDGPFAGPLLERFTLESPAECAVVAGKSTIVEVEFAFRMGEDFSCDGECVDPEALAGAVEAVCPALEVGSLRLPDDLGDPGAALLVADAAGNTALVHGAPVHAWRALDLAAHEATLIVNRERVASGVGGDVLGHPLYALAWLAGFLARRGHALHSGDIITTGTCTGMYPVKIGDEIVADLGRLSEARVTLVEDLR